MIGTCRTVSVVGAYWISSKTSVRWTTDPGVAAIFTPTVNFEVSTLAGMRGDVDFPQAFSHLALAEAAARIIVAGG